MQYLEFEVGNELSPYIKTIWGMESENEEEAYPRSLIMPDGIVEMVFHYEDPFYTYRDNRRELQPQNLAVSMMKKYIEIESAGKTGFIAVRFYPWGAYHFFNEPVSRFLDQTVDVRKLWGNDPSEQLKATGTLELRAELVKKLLLKMLDRYKKDETRTEKAIKLIWHTKGSLSVDEVCNKTGLSKKTDRKKIFIVNRHYAESIFACLPLPQYLSSPG